MPKQGQEVPVTCEVLLVGPGKPKEPMPVRVGENVVVGKYSGIDVVLNDEKYAVVKPEDILGVVD